MANFYPKQYQETGVYPINHNYLPQQFSDYEDIWQQVKQVVVRGDFTLGEAVDEFEKKFALINEAEYGIGVGSGTDALFLSLKALGIGEGDEVITTPFTFYATVGAIVTAGAKPVFVDAADDFNINAELIRSAITSKTKAIMPVHWSGNPCDMDAICALSEQHNIPIVADACHAIDSCYKNKGIAQFSTLSCFSMHPLKNLNVWGDGGIILTNESALADQLYLLRNHGLKGRDECDIFAYNSRLDTIQAVVGNHLIDKRLTTTIQKRIENAAYLDKHLKSIPQVYLPPRSTQKKAVYHLYMGLFEKRNELQTYLQSQGIDAKVHYPVPMHLQPAAKNLGYRPGDFPVAEKIANNCLSLPVHEFINQDQLDHMFDRIQHFYRET